MDLKHQTLTCKGFGCFQANATSCSSDQCSLPSQLSIVSAHFAASFNNILVISFKTYRMDYDQMLSNRNPNGEASQLMKVAVVPDRSCWINLPASLCNQLYSGGCMPPLIFHLAGACACACVCVRMCVCVCVCARVCVSEER